jgi:hypothetical protein
MGYGKTDVNDRQNLDNLGDVSASSVVCPV